MNEQLSAAERLKILTGRIANIHDGCGQYTSEERLAEIIRAGTELQIALSEIVSAAIARRTAH